MSLNLVHIHVKPECVDSFIAVTLYNVENTRREAGAVQFDLLRDAEEPCHFILYEHFRDDNAVASHKTTAHYKKWADEVAAYMTAPRTKDKLVIVE